MSTRIDFTLAEESRTQRSNSPVAILSSGWNFLRRWPVIPVVILVTLLLMSIFASVLAPEDPNKQQIFASLAHPAWDDDYYASTSGKFAEEKFGGRYILGADEFGRDVLSRFIYGARVSLMVALVAMVSGMILGAWVGITAGYYGGLIDELLSRFVDIWNALPFLLVALVVSITIGQGLLIMMALLVMLTWVGLVRNIRAEVLTLKTRDYIAAARIAGASDLHIMFRHLFPGILNLLMVLASLRVGGLILTESALSFLGVGIPSRIPSWGSMISDGRIWLDQAWWISFFPGLGILLTVMSFNFLGDWIRDKTDPRLRQSK